MQFGTHILEKIVDSGQKTPKRQLNIRVVEVRKCLTSLKIMNHGKIAKPKKNYYRYFLKLFGQKLKIKNHKILMKYEIKKRAFYMIFI